LKDIPEWTIPVAHQGNIAAVICQFQNLFATQSKTDIRAVGSTWNPAEASYPASEFVFDNICAVDDDDTIEIYEQRGTKAPFVVQTSLRFVAYILRGDWNDGTGNYYNVQVPIDPIRVTDTAATPTTLDIGASTDANARAVYWRFQNRNTTSPNEVLDSYELGSTDPMTDLRWNFRHLVSSTVSLNDDAELVYQYNPDDTTNSWMYIGIWLEFVRRRRITIV
jgi:hypothetical protein